MADNTRPTAGQPRPGNPYSKALSRKDLPTLALNDASDAGLLAVAHELRTANMIALLNTTTVTLDMDEGSALWQEIERRLGMTEDEAESGQ